MAAIMAKLKQIKKFILVCPIIDGMEYIEELSMSQHIRDLMTSKEKISGDYQYSNIEGYKISRKFISQINGINIEEDLRKANIKATIISNQADTKAVHVFDNCGGVNFIKRNFVKMWQRVVDADYGCLIEEIARQCND